MAIGTGGVVWGGQGGVGGMGGNVPGATGGGSGLSWDDVLKFINSPGGAALIGGGMSGLGAMSAANSQERMMNQQNASNQQMSAQQVALHGGQTLMNDALTRDMGLEQAAPLGWSQGYQQQQLLRNMMLQKMMAGSGVQPTNPDVLDRLNSSGWKPFKPTIPEEWNNVNAFGVNQTMEALANRQGVLDTMSGGRAPGLNFSQMGLPEDMANRLNQSTGQHRQYAADDYKSNAARLLEAINLNRAGTNQTLPGMSGIGQSSSLYSSPNNPSAGGNSQLDANYRAPRMPRIGPDPTGSALPSFSISGTDPNTSMQTPSPLLPLQPLQDVRNLPRLPAGVLQYPNSQMPQLQKQKQNNNPFSRFAGWLA